MCLDAGWHVKLLVHMMWPKRLIAFVGFTVGISALVTELGQSVTVKMRLLCLSVPGAVIVWSVLMVLIRSSSFSCWMLLLLLLIQVGSGVLGLYTSKGAAGDELAAGLVPLVIAAAAVDDDLQVGVDGLGLYKAKDGQAGDEIPGGGQALQLRVEHLEGQQ